MFKTLTLATALIGASAGLGSAGILESQTLSPVAGHSIELGSTHGSAYYVAKPDGYHLVATLYTDGELAPVRFIAVLANGQSASVSVPGPAGTLAHAVTFSRSAGGLVVRESADTDTATQ